MNLDIEKLQKLKSVVITFPSKGKARKFIRALIHMHNYRDISTNPLSEVGANGVMLGIFRDSLITVYESQGKVYEFSEFLLIEEPKLIHKIIIKGKPSVLHNVHYLSKDIDGSELALRYYISFQHRPSYEGCWFIKCKETKEYLKISEEQAKLVADTMCSGSFKRVIGFKEKKGFKRIIVEHDGNVHTTLNNKEIQ